MGGGLMQLVAYGAQDIYLTGNPQITFFKVVYRRHTNFSMEAIEQTWSGSALANNSRVTATVSRNGDLISDMWLDVKFPSVSAGDNPGSLFVQEVELEIGGQRIDKHYGHWLEVWAQLTRKNSAGVCADGDVTSYITTGTRWQNMTGQGGVDVAANTAAKHLQIPLQFWFNRNPGLALPLIALQYHEVKVLLTTGLSTQHGTPTQNQLWVNYIYLDTDERRRFAQQSHEYLIEQVQHQNDNAQNITLNFNHPVKELVWTRSGSAATAATPASIGTIGTNTWQLKLNGHDRFAARDISHFTREQVVKYHSGTPVDLGTAGALKASNDKIGVYSFALKPEEHQPSGTCNFSRIDNAQLVTTATAAATHVYAVNYNVLRIMSGMGGLAYSN